MNTDKEEDEECLPEKHPSSPPIDDAENEEAEEVFGVMAAIERVHDDPVLADKYSKLVQAAHRCWSGEIAWVLTGAFVHVALECPCFANKTALRTRRKVITDSTGAFCPTCLFMVADSEYEGVFRRNTRPVWEQPVHQQLVMQLRGVPVYIETKRDTVVHMSQDCSKGTNLKAHTRKWNNPRARICDACLRCLYNAYVGDDNPVFDMLFPLQCSSKLIQ